MLCSNRVLLLAVVLALSTPPSISAQQLFGSGGLFRNILGLLLGLANPLWNFLARQTCNSIEDLFSVDLVDCTCTGSIDVGGGGLQVGIGCNSIDPICLVPDSDILCGAYSLDAEYSTSEGISSAETCFDIDSSLGLPEDFIIDVDSLITIPELCIEADPAENGLLTFEGCTIALGGMPCRSCTICPNGRSAQFDCSNVDINPINFLNAPVNLPPINTCVGLGVVSRLDAPEGSVVPFGQNV